MLLFTRFFAYKRAVVGWQKGGGGTGQGEHSKGQGPDRLPPPPPTFYPPPPFHPRASKPSTNAPGDDRLRWCTPAAPPRPRGARPRPGTERQSRTRRASEWLPLPRPPGCYWNSRHRLPGRPTTPSQQSRVVSNTGGFLHINSAQTPHKTTRFRTTVASKRRAAARCLRYVARRRHAGTRGLVLASETRACARLVVRRRRATVPLARCRRLARDTAGRLLAPTWPLGVASDLSRRARLGNFKRL